MAKLKQKEDKGKETASKTNQEVGEPSRKEDKGKELASQIEEEEVPKSDDTDTEEDEEDEAARVAARVAARWNNGLGEPTILFSQPDIWEPCSGLDGSLDLGKGCNGPRIAGAAADPIKGGN